MKRSLLAALDSWRNEADRKPLLIRGARQVGKSYIVRQLGKSYQSFVEVNFEFMPELSGLFSENLDPQEIITKLSVALKKQIVPGETLLFLDEVQVCPNALIALRYFYEKMPHLHVIAAGSLIEFAIEQVGMPVGRVRSAYLYPMSFTEFLEASEDHSLVHYLQQHDLNRPLEEIFHKKLLSLFGEYLVVGGMPEAVKSWFGAKDLSAVKRIHKDLLETYKQDFSKYSKRSQVKYLEKIFQAVPQLLGKKFVFSAVDQDLKSRELRPALELLERAGVITRVTHSSGNGIPLAAEAHPARFKVIYLDVGLAQTVLGVEAKDLFLDPEKAIINKGSLVESSIGQELLAYSDYFSKKQLHYWIREKKGSNAEVDYLEVVDNKIVPIEVKSGQSGSLKSLQLFLKEKASSTYGLQISQRNFDTSGKVKNYPLYAISLLFR